MDDGKTYVAPPAGGGATGWVSGVTRLVFDVVGDNSSLRHCAMEPPFHPPLSRGDEGGSRDPRKLVCSSPNPSRACRP